MSQSLTLDVKGLYTYNSDVAGVPAGTLSVADNVNITRMNILEPRRGLEYQYQGANVLTFGSVGDRIKKFVFWKETSFCHYATTFALFSNSGVSSRGTLTTPANATSIRDISFSNKNLYLTNASGILKTDAVANNLFSAGVPKGLSISLTLDSVTGTAIADTKFVSYKYVLGRKDANGVITLSAPSGRATIQNDLGVTTNVFALCYLPSGIDTNFFIQLYRTPESATSSTGEEFYLVFERQIANNNGLTSSIATVQREIWITGTSSKVYIETAKDHGLVNGQKITVAAVTNTSINGSYYVTVDGPVQLSFIQNGTYSNIIYGADTGTVTTQDDISAGAVYIDDVTPADLTGATLYTSPSQEGAVNENNQPPVASDIAEYQNCLWFADTAQKQALQFQLISSTMFLGTTITIGSEVYTGRRFADYTQRIFQIKAPLILISTVARSGTTVTIVTAVPHELRPGGFDPVDIKTANFASVDKLSAAVTIVNATTFTYTQGSGTILTSADSGTVTILEYPSYGAITASASIRIYDTAQSLIRAINIAPGPGYYAYSLSESEEAFPGKILVEARTLTASQFTIVSSKADYWQPNLPTSGVSESQKSQNDAFRNGLMYSKPDQPESVPLKNIFRVGSADDPILRIWAARDALFVFKQRDGLWIIRGETEANWTKNQLDVTAKLYAADSLASVNNTLYALMEAGICEVSDTGVNVLSFPIRDQLFDSYTKYDAATKLRSFGVGNDTEGKYILSIPQSTTNAYCEKQIVFDVYSRIFCGNWYIQSTTGRLNQYDQKIYFGPNQNKIKKEIRTFEATDFVDEFQTLSIVTVGGTGLILTLNSVANIEINDVIKQGSIYVYILAIDNMTNQVTVDMIETWTTGITDVIHYKALDVKVEWNSEFAGNPAGFKHFYEMSLLQKSSFLITSTFYFRNDINSAESFITIPSPTYSGNWGDFTWGDETWGGDPTSNTPVRLGVPRTHARCSQLRVRWEHKVSYSWFQVQGISLVFNPTSTRIMRNAP